MARIQSTKQKSKDQEAVSSSQINFLTSSLFGSFLVILSGCILYLDKIITFFNMNINIPSRFEEYDLNTLIWSVSVTISPLLLILSAHLKTIKAAYVVPLYCYTLQLWFIVYDLNIIDKEYTYAYAMGTCVLFYFVYKKYRFNQKDEITKRIEKRKEELLNEL